MEGSPESAAKLFRQRPEHICIHAVLCSRPRTVAFMEQAADNPLTRGIAELMPDSYMAFHYRNMPREGAPGQIQVGGCKCSGMLRPSRH